MGRELRIQPTRLRDAWRRAVRGLLVGRVRRVSAVQLKEVAVRIMKRRDVADARVDHAGCESHTSRLEFALRHLDIIDPEGDRDRGGLEAFEELRPHRFRRHKGNRHVLQVELDPTPARVGAEREAERVLVEVLGTAEIAYGD